MSSRIGQYDHLEPVLFPLDMDQLAEHLVEANYGVHRFLCALIRARKKTKRKDDRLIKELEKLLEEGAF